MKMTKHQALYNALTTQCGYEKDIIIESGFEGDSLWVDEEEEWNFIEESDIYEGWLKEVGLKKEELLKSDGWVFWQSE